MLRAGYGYDILFGNPQSKGKGDPGYKELIFDVSNHSEGQSLDGYIVPNGITAADADSCESEFHFHAMTGSNAYSKGLQQSVSIGAGFTGTAFSLSAGYQHFYEETANTSSLFTSSSAQCSVYRATLNAPYSLPSFTANFEEEIKNMPSTYSPSSPSNKAFFYDFMNLYFGTHYLIEIELGGMFGAQYKMSEYAFSSFASSNLSISGSCNYAAQDSFDFAGMTRTEQTEATDFESVTEDNEIWYIGGRFPANGTWQEWAATLKNSSMPIVITLDEISNLLTTSNFPNDKEIENKQKALKAAINGYCIEVSMDPNYNKSLTVLCDGFPPDKAMPPLSIFGGSYSDDKYGIYNPYTDGINCPAEFKAFAWIQYNYDHNMKQYVCINETQLHHYKRDAMGYFGGMYGKITRNNNSTACLFENPWTDDCSCGEGMKHTEATTWINAETDHYRGYVCYNESVKIGRTILGGFFQTGHIEIANVYTNTQSCPANYLPFQVAHFHCDGHFGEKGQTCDLWMCTNNVYKLNQKENE